MDGGERVIGHHALRDQDRVLEIAASPGSKRHQSVAAQRQVAVGNRSAVAQRFAFLDLLAFLDNRALVKTSILVGPDKSPQTVGFFAQFLVIVSDNDLDAIHFLDDAGSLGQNNMARIVGDLFLNPGHDQRRLGLDQRRGLPLHV